MNCAEIVRLAFTSILINYSFSHLDLPSREMGGMVGVE